MDTNIVLSNSMPLAALNLTSVQMNIASALMDQNCVSSVDENFLTKKIKNLIAEFISFVGHKVDEQQILVDAMAVFRDLSHYHKFLKINEIDIAIDNGRIGKYGEYIHFSPKLFIDWIAKYKSDEDRLAAAKAVLKISKTSQVNEVPSDSEREQWCIEATKAGFERFKKTGQFNDYGNVVYNFLKNKKIVEFSDEKKQQAIKKAQRELFREFSLKAEKGMFDSMKKHEAKRLRDLANVISNEYDSLNADNKGTIISRAKQILIKEYFADIIEIGSDIANYFP